ncbi:MAG: S8 family serine peptidase [Lachnospiraceae bacterium]|nr:S8 family serine peptidase [Lachnospiraceae bacterium]
MSEKFDNALNLALQTEEEVRVRSDNLNAAFTEGTRRWEVIVKYFGSLEELRTRGIEVEYLLGDFAILQVPEAEMAYLGEVRQIEYAELPRRFFYQAIDVKAESCIYPLVRGEQGLDGTGILIAVLDSGIELRNPEFQNPDGSTRVVYLWDQQRGEEYSGEQLDSLLQAGAAVLPGADVTGHGTAVAGIAAGTRTGIATAAGLLIVKLGTQQGDGFPMTTQIMRGLDAVIRKALELGQPLVINLSFGNTYGPHDGTGLLARYLDTVSGMGRNTICVGTGNEGDTGGHVNVELSARNVVQLSVAEYEPNLSIQMWQNYADELSFAIYSPAGERIPLPPGIADGKYEVITGNTRLLVYFGLPTPYSVKREIYIEMLPVRGNYISSGLWEIEIVGISVVSGSVTMYLPSQESRGEGTVFLRPTPEETLTIPSTAQMVISVAGYNSVFASYAPFSGRGYVAADSALITYSKPDITAPAVNIPAPSIYGGMAEFTGTSFATPIVSGAAALLMEQGIVRGEDVYLYGEKLKATLQKSAVRERGERYPNVENGWGKLCASPTGS